MKTKLFRESRWTRSFPLGTPVPNKEHAVCVSLPTFDDVIGYEEKRPETLQRLPSGYPRFVRHRKVSELAEFWNQTHSLHKDLFFFPNAKDWEFAKEIIGISNATTEYGEDYLIVGLETGSEESIRLHKFFQHSGLRSLFPSCRKNPGITWTGCGNRVNQSK